MRLLWLYGPCNMLKMSHLTKLYSPKNQAWGLISSVVSDKRKAPLEIGPFGLEIGCPVELWKCH